MLRIQEVKIKYQSYSTNERYQVKSKDYLSLVWKGVCSKL